ncbi:MAG TPA: response regulator [bacterium]|nr:response regulator [bacterium]
MGNGNGSRTCTGKNYADNPLVRQCKQIRFLIVHENAPVRKLIKSILRNMGFTLILEDSSTGNFLGTLKKENVHVLICSGKDSDHENWDWVKTLRTQEHARKTGVMILSSVTDKETILGAIQAGVDDYIVMPFSAQAFEERINALFQKRQLLS